MVKVKLDESKLKLEQRKFKFGERQLTLKTLVSSLTEYKLKTEKAVSRSTRKELTYMRSASVLGAILTLHRID